MPNKPVSGFGLSRPAEFSRGIKLLHPDAAALRQIRDSAIKVGSETKILAKDSSSAFRQSVEQQKDLLERTITDPSRFVEAIQTLHTLQAATNNLARIDK